MKKKVILLFSALCFLQMQAQKPQTNFHSTIKVDANDSKETIIEKSAHIIPTPNQLSALQNEFIAFVHFGPNTFTRMEWGNGMEDPKVFDLRDLDTDQWCEAMKAANMKMVILTAKHHDGFVLWQSRYTEHGVMSTNFRNGQGDILKDLAKSCKKYGLKLGIYLSPADLFQIESPQGLYGNLSKYTERTIPREVPGRPFKNKTKFKFVVDDYNEYFLNQLFEVLTEYGPIHEVWFDGAHPKTKGGQKYNYQAWRKLIRTLAPNATIFGREDVRWCGNEAGATRDTEWNVITYKDDPHTMNDYMDLYGDLGTRSVYYSKEKPFYLHYQPAETNTSIREGWFYRDDTFQKVRSADDVFDIYERSTGGNSIFLLNIPPNREGRFSDADVNVLKETGKRINETYQKSLLNHAKGPKQVLDNNPETYIVLDAQAKEIVISTPKPITINRLAIQEPISQMGERVEKHAIDAYINGKWQNISEATNIGYKRIHRFPDITTDKIRIRMLESRLTPAICSVSAHYYRSRPPMLSVQRNLDGYTTIEPIKQKFNWRSYDGQFGTLTSNENIKIYYTTDGSTPNVSSTKYSEPFFMENGEIKAIAMLDDATGPMYHGRFGLVKKNWKLLKASSAKAGNPATNVFDENSTSYWMSEQNGNPYIAIDLGKEEELNGFAYTPQNNNAEGMIEEGVFCISQDGSNWQEVEPFIFGNLINDPTQRSHFFKQAVKARYISIKATRIAGNSKVASMAELDLF